LPKLKVSPALKKRAAQIQVLLMDVDGTMTDGGVTLLSQTEEVAIEIKTFDAHDGQGLTLAHTAGIRTGCITGRQSSALLRRAREMHMEFIRRRECLSPPWRLSETIFRIFPSCVESAWRSRWAMQFLRSKKLRTTRPKHSPATVPFARRLSSFSNPKASGKR
jgi:hypothetical protein